MKKKNLFPIILLVVIIVLSILAITTTNIEKTPKDNKDITPEEEISNENLRETVVTLYFIDKETQTLKSEGKLIDSSLLLENPYKTIVQFLIEGPKSETLETAFPQNTQILGATISKDCVTLNFSNELLNFKDDTQKYNIVNCILNSLSQLTEVNSIKIQINGESVNNLGEEYCRIH